MVSLSSHQNVRNELITMVSVFSHQNVRDFVKKEIAYSNNSIATITLSTIHFYECKFKLSLFL